MRENYIVIVLLGNEGEKPERLIVNAHGMYDVVKYVDKLYPERSFCSISKANAFEIKKDDEVYKI